MKTRKKTKSFALALRLRARAATLLIAMLCCVTGAWADHEVTIATNLSQTTYTSGDVTIAFSYDVDGDGGYVLDEDRYPMTISVSSGVIKSVVLRLGYYAEYAECVHTSGNVGTRTISPKTGEGLEINDPDDPADDEVIAVWQNKDTWVTFSGINASSVTIYSDDWVQIDEVKVTYADVVAVNGVSLSPTSAVLNVGQITTLTATVSPGDATNKAVTWSTSNPSVATVANGVVTAVGVGSATITATTTDGAKTASCAVTVANPIAAASADGTIGAFTDANGQTRLGIVATLGGKKYAIAMSNETDITGLSGTYTKKVGDYTYYNFADACAKFANNQTDGSYTASNVWRLPTAAEFTALANLGGSWNGTGYTWTIGGNSLFLPAAGYNDAYPVSGVGYYWSSTQPQFLYFYGGSISMPNGGTSTGMPLRLFCQLPYVNVTGVTLAQTEGVLTVGETLTLTATIAPANATDKSVTWTTSDASVVTVDGNGVVTAQGLGTATITATATNGTADTSDDLSTTCTVTVAAPINALSEVGTVGAFTDVNGQTRLGIVTMLNGSKYAISMSNETDISGLSGTYTKKVGDYTYYNFADACAKFANNQTDGSYIASNVWRLPTAAEFQNLIALGGSWNGTGYTWTIGGNSLFLPAAGYNDAYPVSGVGYYWSSTQPQFLYFNNGSIFMTNGGTSTGMPLRLFCQLPYVNVTGVTLAQTEGVLTVGETLTLTATIAPINATDKSVTWTTSDAAVVTVDANGVVTAQGLGTTTITATATNGTADTSDDLTATCTVTVATPITAASADGTVGVFTDANGQSRLGIVVTLSGEKYAIAMSNETDLTGLSGTYTKKDGNYTYYNFADACAKFANNQTDGSYTAANVWRLPTAAEFTALIGLGGTWDNTTGHTGYIWTIGANSLFLPAAGYYESSVQNLNSYGFYWSSNGWEGYSNMMIFNSGSSYIGNGGPSSGMPLRLFCQLPYTAVTGVTLSPTEASLIVGETTTLTPTVAPATATDMTVTWKTSDDAVATVSNGVVTAVGAGTAIITVTATNGTVDTSDDKAATCTVTVSYPTYDLTANPGADGEYWATFYSDASNYEAPSGTQVFMVSLSGSAITMTEVTDRIVKSGQGVVLKMKNTTGSSITMTPTTEAATADFTGNSLTGTMTSITNPGNAYVLNKTNANGVGFYKLSSGGTIGANKAYLTYSGTLAREFFLFDEATGISATLMNNEEVNGEVYDLQGRRVSQPTKGLYIVNGKKYIKK